MISSVVLRRFFISRYLHLPAAKSMIRPINNGNITTRQTMETCTLDTYPLSTIYTIVVYITEPAAIAVWHVSSAGFRLISYPADRPGSTFAVEVSMSTLLILEDSLTVVDFTSLGCVSIRSEYSFERYLAMMSITFWLDEERTNSESGLSVWSG